nr:pentatricopeptide repeat-containing protein At4g14850 [Ipomoea batatas]
MGKSVGDECINDCILHGLCNEYKLHHRYGVVNDRETPISFSELHSACRVHSIASFNLRRSFNFAARFLQRRAGTGAAVDSGGGLAIVDSVKQDYLHAIDSFSLLFLPINEDRSAMLLFQSSISHSIFVKFLSKVLISPLFIVFNRSRSENSSSKVLDYPPSVAFNHSPWSRSMESVGESMSTVLISSTLVVICMEQIHEEESEHVEHIHKSLLFDSKSLMSLNSQSVGTSNKQSAVELDFELRLAFFYLSLFPKSESGYEVNNSEIKSHRKSICICDSVGIVASPSQEFPARVVKKEGTHEVIFVAYELVRRRRIVAEKPIDASFGNDTDLNAVISSLILDVFVGCSALDMYSKTCIRELADKVFEEMPDRNIAKWNVCISNAIIDGRHNDVVKRPVELLQMGKEPPNSITSCAFLNACSNGFYLKLGMQLHNNVTGRDHDLDISVLYFHKLKL